MGIGRSKVLRFEIYIRFWSVSFVSIVSAVAILITAQFSNLFKLKVLLEREMYRKATMVDRVSIFPPFSASFVDDFDVHFSVRLCW